MNIDYFLRQESEWLKGIGPHANIAMSSRTRLARNIDKRPFSHKASADDLEAVFKGIESAAKNIAPLKQAICIRLEELGEVDRLFLVERHLMSPEHAKDGGVKGLIVDPKESVSVMINEEDHLRIQVMQSGMSLKQAWHTIDQIDTEFSKTLSFAYSTKWGYLTACPTNTGTGLRGSVMMHLPALVFTNEIGRVLQATAKLGLNIRGLYGEGTEASGNLFQVSNQVSLGRTEDEIIDGIERIIVQIIAREEQMRKNILMKNKAALSDRVWRAYGTLKSAHIITSTETISLLSAIRLGIDLGIVKNLDMRAINELIIQTQPAHLQKLEGKVLDANERDIKRANIIREKLK